MATLLKKSFVLSQLKEEIKLIRNTYSKPYTQTIKSMVRGLEIAIRIVKEIN